MTGTQPGPGGRPEPFRDLEPLVRAMNYQLAACAYRILGNKDDAQDVVQETFLNIMRNWSRVGGLTTFPQQRAYLFKSVIRQAWQMTRKAYRQRELPGVEVADPGYTPNAFDEHAQSARDDLQFVWTVLNGLPEGRRDAAILFAAGYEYREIAGMLNIAVSTVGSHVSEARKKLRDARPEGRGEGSP